MLISESGGLLYHFQAYRYQMRLWSPFVRRLDQWLQSTWSPPRDRPLILIGSSAGWCLRPEFIGSFEQVHAYDLDPFALWLLKKRCPSARLHTHTQDGLGILSSPPADALHRILDSYPPDSSILFCNLWGQVFMDEKAENRLPFWKRNLEGILTDRTWASFHDRVSGDIPPRMTAENESSQRRLNNNEIIERFYSAPDSRPGREIELLDHRTGEFFPDMYRLHLHWELQPGRHHLIEGICSRFE
jgi:hypothetical protein